MDKGRELPDTTLELWRVIWSRRAFTIAFTLALAACSHSEGSPPETGASPAADVVSAPGVSLGRNWYSLETYRGDTFRWANNNAQLLVDRSALQGKSVYIDLEPGPSIKSSPMSLSVNAGPGDSMTVQVANRETIAVQPSGDTITMHVANGGKAVADDLRLLNFRVFRVTSTAPAASSSNAATGPDVVASDVQIGNNWGALEHYNGQTFRWIDNDATVSVPEQKSGTLQLTLEPGPGIKSFPFTLDVYTSSGRLVKALSVGPKGGKFSVPLANGVDKYRLHVNGGGKKISSDPRILNVRVFDLRITTA